MSKCPVVFLNGPPRCGKDTLAGHIVRSLPGFRAVKFAAILKERTHALYGYPHLPHDAFEFTKDIPNHIFLGLTPREAYISVSQKLLKPLHGDRVFGDLLLSKIRYQNPLIKAFVISDSGFESEALPIIEHFGADNCLLIKLHRKGCDFSKDSRSYIDLPIETLNFHNDGDISDFPWHTRHLNQMLQSMVGGN